MRDLLLLLTISLLFVSCTSNDATFPVSGKIVHNQTEAGNLNEDFTFTSQSFALISLSQINTEGNEEIVYQQRIENLDTLPIEFTLDPEIEIQRKGSFYVKAEVFANKSNVVFVGDLVSQYPYTVSPQTNSLEMEVFGVEHCEAETADEFCTTRDEIPANCGSVAGQSFKGPADPPQCLRGEGCGNEGSIGFSDNSENASFHAINSDAIALLSYTQENSSVNLFFESETNSTKFNLINDCLEIQHQKSGNVYRLMSHPWTEVVH